MGADKRNREDPYVRRLREELAKAYGAKHPRAQIEVKREYPACVRVRVLDPGFAHKDRVDRNEAVWEVIRTLPEEWWNQISLLIVLTPKEAKTSLMNRFEFEELPPYNGEVDSPKEPAKRR
ncbi:MAG TPA: hypothetical protein VN688_07205 [Gemmataceae bacterium]|nr:hypothetical protein [Gemmataceae bacterium]